VYVRNLYVSIEGTLCICVLVNRFCSGNIKFPLIVTGHDGNLRRITATQYVSAIARPRVQAQCTEYRDMSTRRHRAGGELASAGGDAAAEGSFKPPRRYANVHDSTSARRLERGRSIVGQRFATMSPPRRGGRYAADDRARGRPPAPLLP